MAILAFRLTATSIIARNFEIHRTLLPNLKARVLDLISYTIFLRLDLLAQEATDVGRGFRNSRGYRQINFKTQSLVKFGRVARFWFPLDRGFVFCMRNACEIIYEINNNGEK